MLYPLTKEEANTVLDMTSHPGWSLFLRCVQFEADQYVAAAMQTEYGPYALEKFRFNQALANNIPRIPRAVLEKTTEIAESNATFDSIYDDLSNL